jgi:sec-independent protein translocase protein TatA
MRLGSLGPAELILIVLAIVLIFGASKLGDLGGALGKSVREFKKATKDDEAEAAERQTTVTTTTIEPTSPSAPPVEKAPAVKLGDYRPPDAKTG